jgi:hypothetical protein
LIGYAIMYLQPHPGLHTSSYLVVNSRGCAAQLISVRAMPQEHTLGPRWTTMTTDAAAYAQRPANTVGQVPGCPPHVLAAIYGAKPSAEEKAKMYETSLQR